MIFVFFFSDFALNQYLRVRSEDDIDLLPEYYIAELLQLLDLTSYLLDTPCSRDEVPFVNATNGWNSGKWLINGTFIVPDLFLNHSNTGLSLRNLFSFKHLMKDFVNN